MIRNFVEICDPSLIDQGVNIQTSTLLCPSVIHQENDEKKIVLNSALNSHRKHHLTILN